MIGWTATHWWLPASLSFLASPVGMIVVAAVAERRWLRARESYVSFYFGDIGLAVAAGVAGALLRADPHVIGLFRAAWWRPLSVAVSVLVGLGTWWLDAKARVPSGPRKEELIYERSQILSPTKVFHNTVCYTVLGTVFLTTTLPALLTRFAWSSWTAFGHLVIAGCVAFWIYAVAWDTTHVKPLAHVPARHWWYR